MRTEPILIPTGTGADAATRHRAKLRETTQEFEAYFLQTVLKEMRKTIPKSAIDRGSENQYYTEMLDEVFARAMSKTGRFGLGDALYRSLERSAAAVPVENATSEEKEGTP